ncbi:hypothetical protein [Rhodococcus qingshengii]|uniref:hypothetical protein n=1 Tax=Rhodococcus qingshengii TaxID=334542 RepID=UPI001F1CEEAD|nr:hypothetical protein [Rhodococcus qingshengii]
MEISIVLAWVGLVATLVGIPLTYYLARRGRQRPDLRSVTDFDVIISSEEGILDRLHMDFDGDKIRSVSRTRIAIWNARGDTVRGSDIVPTDRLRLQLDSEDLALHVRILAMSREQIDAECEIDSNDPTAAVVSFDFLDASDGFIVELLHMKPVAAELIGTIRGAVVSGEKTADLSPSALDKVAERWFRRLKDPKTVRQLVPILFLVPMTGYAVFEIVKGKFRDSSIVDAAEFDLTTSEGQRSFSEAVTDTGNIDVPTLIVPVILALFLSIVVLGFVTARGQLKSVIPRSIVMERPDSSERKDEGDNMVLSQ